MFNLDEICSNIIDLSYEINIYKWGNLIKTGNYQLFIPNLKTKQFTISYESNYHSYMLNIISNNYEEIIVEAILYFKNFYLHNQFYFLEKEFNKYFSKYKNNYFICVEDKYKFKFTYKKKYCFYINMNFKEIYKNYICFIDLEDESYDKIKFNDTINITIDLEKIINKFKEYINIDNNNDNNYLLTNFNNLKI
jgi:hypothetical protein